MKIVLFIFKKKYKFFAFIFTFLQNCSKYYFISYRVLCFIASATSGFVRTVDNCRIGQFANGLDECTVFRVPSYVVLQNHRGENDATGAGLWRSPHHLDLSRK